MDNSVSLEAAINALRDIYGNTRENGFEDGKDAMTETLEEQLHIGKNEARQLVEGLIEARTVRFEGSSGSLPAAANQATEVPLVDGIWHL